MQFCCHPQSLLHLTDNQFKLYVDASDVGAGAVLQQQDDQGNDHSVSYFSRKFEDIQRD